MKTIYTLAAVALLAAGAANAQSAQNADICAQNLIANSKIITKAQAATTAAARKAILKAAIDANPANAVCIADLALQMTTATNVNPAAGPEDFGGDVPTTTDGNTPPAENPNQLNQPNGTPSTSPAAPAPVIPTEESGT